MPTIREITSHNAKRIIETRVNTIVDMENQGRENAALFNTYMLKRDIPDLLSTMEYQDIEDSVLHIATLAGRVLRANA